LVTSHADSLICLQYYVLVLTLKNFLYVIWENQDQIWVKIFRILKNMHSRTLMSVGVSWEKKVTEPTALKSGKCRKQRNYEKVAVGFNWQYFVTFREI